MIMELSKNYSERLKIEMNFHKKKSVSGLNFFSNFPKVSK